MVVTTPGRSDDSLAASSYLRAPMPVHFPVDEFVPETKRHLRQRTTLWQLLDLAFRDRAAIGCDQFVYWDPTDPQQCLAPDAFVRLGVPDEQFESWKVWERGAPEVAVEILSQSDKRDRNLEEKVESYRRLGVRELVFFDSERDPPSLRVWEAVDGDLVERRTDGHLAQSRCLPGTWVLVPDPESGALLRLSRDPEGKALFPTPDELRIAAEERVKELEAELRRRGG
jgi:Uma2 family endonuclease